MGLEKVYNEIAKKADVSYYVEIASEEVMFIPAIIEMIESGNIHQGQWAENILEKISEEKPELVYPYITYIEKQLKNISFVSWNVWKIISNMLICDYFNKWDEIRDGYFQALNTEKIAEFSIVCDCVEKILKYKPQEAEEITAILKNTENRVFKIAGKASDGCLKVAKEKANETLEKIGSSL